MGFGMAAIAVAGSVVSGMGAAKSAKVAKKQAKATAKAEKKAAEIEGKFAQENADFTRENATIISSIARQDMAQANRESRIRLGAITAAAGASGGRLHSGSVLDIISDVASQGELESQTIKFRSDLAVRDTLQKAKGFDVQVELSKLRAEAAEEGGQLGAKAAGIAGQFGVASALLGGISGAVSASGSK